MMNRKLIAASLILILIFVLSSCDGSRLVGFTSNRGPLPYGKWQSKDPDLVIDINPELEEFSGIYKLDKSEASVYISFAPDRKEFSVYSINDRPGGVVDFYKLAYFSGNYKLKEGKLNYKLQPYWQELTGYKTIIFEKVEDYKASNDDT